MVLLVINMNNCWANVETSQRQLAIAYKYVDAYIDYQENVLKYQQSVGIHTER